MKPVSSNQLCCEKCGAAQFMEGRFGQYRSIPSSRPGGDLSPVTEQPIRVLICLCGNPIQPGLLRSHSYSKAERQSFQRSFAAAQKFWESTQPAAIIQKLLQDRFATQQQYDVLADRVAFLATLVEELHQRPPK